MQQGPVPAQSKRYRDCYRSGCPPYLLASLPPTLTNSLCFFRKVSSPAFSSSFRR